MKSPVWSSPRAIVASSLAACVLNPLARVWVAPSTTASASSRASSAATNTAAAGRRRANAVIPPARSEVTRMVLRTTFSNAPACRVFVRATLQGHAPGS